MKKILILGATGSIGCQTLEYLASKDDIVVGLSCFDKTDILFKQCHDYNCKTIAVTSANADISIFDAEYTLYRGETALMDLVNNTDFDIMVNAVVGISGLLPTIAALKKGKIVALANKETLVTGGDFVMNIAKEYEGTIIPIDSEHSALWQAIKVGDRKDISQLTITASGGALRDFPLEQLYNSSVKDVLKHPNWSMGNKITVDCATMINKAFEIIEAKYLFGIDYSRVNAVIHRESIIHGMATFSDGTTSAIMSYADMKLPIALALEYPKRPNGLLPSIDLAKIHSLTFDDVDAKRYPLYYLTRSLVEKNPSYNVLINALDEILVDKFLDSKIAFGDIYKIIYSESEKFNPVKLNTPEEIVLLDREIKEKYTL